MMTTVILIATVAVIAVLFFLWQPESEEKDTTQDATPTETQLPAVSGTRLRVLTANELISTLDLQPVIDNIKIHSGLSTENWNKDGLPLIHNFLSLVQRLPASESHHHAGDGGLARHTLDVAALALRQAAGRSFPPNGKTEDIPRLTAVWKYGILVAALLHDVGKVLTGFNITLSDINNKNSKLWLPDAGNMPPNSYYQVDFLAENHRYSEHAEIGWSFFKDLVPESTRQWIADSSPDLLVLLRYYLSGKKDGSIIEELVKSADMASVSRDLASGSRQRFASAKRIPLIEIIMDNLREMLSERGRYFTIAKDAGGDLFRKGEIIYLISKNVPDYIRKYIEVYKTDYASTLPDDNNRIFDTLLEYRAIKPNPYDENKSITNIAVQFIKGGKISVRTHFTVLAFDAKTLYPDGNYPVEFSGDLQVVEEKPIKTPQTDTENNADDNQHSDNLNDNKTDTNNSETDTETTNTDTTDNYVVPPIMANPFAEQQANIATDTDDDENTDLSALLNMVNQKDNIVSSNDMPLNENSNNSFDTDFSSIDDLLTQSGVLDNTDTENTVTEQNAIIQNNVSGNQNEHNKNTTPKNRKETQQETLKKLKSIFGDDFNDKNKKQDKKEEQNMETTQEITPITATENDEQQVVNEMPRPIPVKAPNTLDNIYDTKRDFNIKKALSNNIENEPNPLKQQGLKFLHWLADGLADGSITFNTAQSFVHFVEQGMLVVSPAAFREFAGEFNARNPNCPGRETQKGFELLNLIERGVRRTSLYRAFSNEQPLFFCYLIPDTRLHHIIQMSTRPANNPNLTIIPADEMFYKKDK